MAMAKTNIAHYVAFAGLELTETYLHLPLSF